MSEILMDENGKPVDKEGKNEKKSYDAASLPKGTINGIISEFFDKMYKVAYNLTKASSGTSLDAANKAAKDAQSIITGGEALDFFLRNSRFTENGAISEYLSKAQMPGTEDKHLVIAFWEMFGNLSRFKDEFCKFMGDLENEGLWRIYHVKRFEYELSCRASSEFMNNLEWIFKEFEELYEKCDSPNIYRAIGEDVNKKNFSEYELNIAVKYYMDKEIKGLSDLSTVLFDIESINPEGDNLIYAVDRATKEYWGFAGKEDKIADLRGKCSDLQDLLKKVYADSDKSVHEYLDAIDNVLSTVSAMLEGTMERLNLFRCNKNESPYCIMHVPASIESIASRYALGEIPDPLSKGTVYHKLIWKMPGALQRLLGKIVRNAPED